MVPRNRIFSLDSEYTRPAKSAGPSGTGWSLWLIPLSLANLSSIPHASPTSPSTAAPPRAPAHPGRLSSSTSGRSPSSSSLRPSSSPLRLPAPHLAEPLLCLPRARRPLSPASRRRPRRPPPPASPPRSPSPSPCSAGRRLALPRPDRAALCLVRAAATPPRTTAVPGRRRPARVAPGRHRSGPLPPCSGGRRLALDRRPSTARRRDGQRRGGQPFRGGAGGQPGQGPPGAAAGEPVNAILSTLIELLTDGKS